jgi:hypothetical protein
MNLAPRNGVEEVRGGFKDPKAVVETLNIANNESPFFQIEFRARIGRVYN